MPDDPPIPLKPFKIDHNSSILSAIRNWQFADAFVLRLLETDIPLRAKFHSCQIWGYLGPDQEIVGFGTIDVCDDYRRLTNGRPHTYLPLLAVNPLKQGRGYGTAIVKHLVARAALLVCQKGNNCHDALLLDVYMTSHIAIALYKKCGFVSVTDEPIHDPLENKFYMVMAKRVSKDRRK
jgi:ribosomal protein S18 acetylase RimI-like enzyme